MKSISLSDIANTAILQFAKTDVLINKVQIADRQQDLLRAMLLHHQEHQPVNIYFKNGSGELFGVECEVIAVTDEHVMLKSGIIIPVRSIVLIELL
ncbi:hypothetical protein [Cesiribacter sp. SM1]|uniref:hypothetical protein n=1 Tax=Cesiribacter sp. SM1 TaxID=2861196 RepID=UPI001CD677C5|nr:hypothetical protein [Cesiribacter sp. SM1]